MLLRLKQSGLAFLNLLFVALAIAGVQPLVRRALGDQGALVVGAVVLVAYALGARLLERRAPSELAPRTETPRFLGGLAIGIALFSGVMGVLWVLGAYEPSGLGTLSRLPGGLALAFAVGVAEEVLFRGLLFRIVERLAGTWGALLVGAALFGLAHGKNPGATLWSDLAIAVEAGLLLGAAFAATRGLGLPIGIHVGWNFTEGSVFGVTASGAHAVPGAVAGVLEGPAFLTGGAFGPENSAPAVALCLLLAVWLLRSVVRHGRVEPPCWSRAVRLATRPAAAPPSA